MAQRVITGLILVAVFVPLLIFSDTVLFTVAVSLLSLIGVWEMLSCLGAKKLYGIIVPSLIMASGAPLCIRLSPMDMPAAWAIGMILLYLFWLAAYCVIKRGSVTYSLVTSVFMSVIYITAGFSSLILLSDSTLGAYVFWLVFIGAWVTDTMAYFCGFLFGKHKLIPEISPKKTIEGAIGGTLFAGLAFVLYGFIVSKVSGIPMHLMFLFITGIISAIVAQFGDLIASAIKREAGIKDYGSLFPGHGGVLDRFDSIIALSPFILMIHAAPFINLIK
ncbi:MAG: phosphatidate cytidylyltransferase [Clostridia bacterium]|nr:phosphatidate cytidylyltransferase [Clostridia bacterium]